MKKLSPLLGFFLFYSFLFAQEGSNTKFIKNVRIGTAVGYSQYFGKNTSTLPDKVAFNSNKITLPDVEPSFYKVFGELETRENILINVGIGYKEITYGETVETSPGNIFSGFRSFGTIGNYTQIDLHAGYSYKWEVLEIVPYIGLSGQFSSGTTTYTSSSSIDSSIIVGPIVTEQLKANFFTFDSGFDFRFWFSKNWSIYTGVSYSKGLSKIIQQGGDFVWNGTKGTISGTMNGSHVSLEFGVLYRFNRKKQKASR